MHVYRVLTQGKEFWNFHESRLRTVGSWDFGIKKKPRLLRFSINLDHMVMDFMGFFSVVNTKELDFYLRFSKKLGNKT